MYMKSNSCLFAILVVLLIDSSVLVERLLKPDPGVSESLIIWNDDLLLPKVGIKPLSVWLIDAIAHIISTLGIEPEPTTALPFSGIHHNHLATLTV